MVDLSKTSPAERFTNSTCGLGTVAGKPTTSCILKLFYTSNSGGVTYDLNGDGKLDISDFTLMEIKKLVYTISTIFDENISVPRSWVREILFIKFGNV